MAITVNTTKSIKQTSHVLADKIKATTEKMKMLMEQAGYAEYKTVKTMIPKLPGSTDDVVQCSINGAKFYFQRGVTVNVPEPIIELLEQCGKI